MQLLTDEETTKRQQNLGIIKQRVSITGPPVMPNPSKEILEKYKVPPPFQESTTPKESRTIYATQPTNGPRPPVLMNAWTDNPTLVEGTKGGEITKQTYKYKGRTYKVRIGKRGGKYILVGKDKKKIYI